MTTPTETPVSPDRSDDGQPASLDVFPDRVVAADNPELGLTEGPQGPGGETPPATRQREIRVATLPTKSSAVPVGSGATSADPLR
jgi:hypothetical protein